MVFAIAHRRAVPARSLEAGHESPRCSSSARCKPLFANTSNAQQGNNNSNLSSAEWKCKFSAFCRCSSVAAERARKNSTKARGRSKAVLAAAQARCLVRRRVAGKSQMLLCSVVDVRLGAEWLAQGSSGLRIWPLEFLSTCRGESEQDDSGMEEQRGKDRQRGKMSRQEAGRLYAQQFTAAFLMK
jgi:hypothetical protein